MQVLHVQKRAWWSQDAQTSVIVRGFLLNPWIKGATCALSTESFFCIHPSFKKTFPGAGLDYVRGSGQGGAYSYPFGSGFVCVFMFSCIIT